MTPEKTEEKTQAAFYQADFFSAIIQDLKLKAVHRFSTHNLFSLSNRPRQNPIRHVVQQGDLKTRITVRNDAGMGVATVFDQDVLLFLVSVLVKERDETNYISSRPEFSPSDYFHFKGIKKASGKDHQNFFDALQRLQNTFVEVSLEGTDPPRKTGNRHIIWNWISYIDLITNENKTKVIAYRVEVPQAIVDAISKNQFLTVDRSYFKITSPIQRFLYLYARKAVGRKREWTESISSLYKKTATEDKLAKFKWTLKKLEGVQLGAEPWVYTLKVDGDNVTFYGRDTVRASNIRQLKNVIGQLTTSKTVGR